LSAQRSAIIRGDVAALRSAPSTSAALLWRAEPGVVGRISKCTSGWCWFDVRGQAGYVEMSHIWGVGPGEAVE